MQRDNTELQEFITLYEQGYGERLNEDEAGVLMDQLLQLYRILVRKPPTEPYP
jgi:hypothetical protein